MQGLAVIALALRPWVMIYWLYTTFGTLGGDMMGKRIEERTDPEILEEMGARLAAIRKVAGLNQEEAATRAGLNRTTVSSAERGGNANILTVVRLLRVYGRLGTLDSFIPKPDMSPMNLVRTRQERTSG
jgi:putative transcriptional regulator